MKYRHFRVEEREKIQEMLWQKASVRGIARELGRHPSSVSREIKRNKPPKNNQYTPRLADERALEHRRHRGRTERLKNEKIRAYVIAHLKRRWSPEQIAGRMRKDGVGSISHEAIYRFIYHQIHRGGGGTARTGCEDLRQYLRRRRRMRLRRGSRKHQRIFRPIGPSIEERPKIVLRRKRIGDWEGDTVESKDRKPGVNTLVERKIGLVFITRLKDKSSASTVQVMANRFRDVPEKFKRTVTLDNGPENSDWQSIKKTVGIDSFSTHPYSAWERPTNENTNSLIRDYFPKKTDFSMISDDEIRFVEEELNSRPRKRLSWKTPLEVWGVALGG
ncbi:MAG: IS30 family transposase [Patescibacteria group bacterium]|nr:IS30 family transposase [Patescibacteria group bacterium]